MTTTATLISNQQAEIAEQVSIIRKSFDREVQLRARVAELQRELENERARDIHSCGPNCQRTGCVNRRLREENEALRKFVLEVSKQTPEKPDYWSSCGQCGSNISEAEDILATMKGQ